MKSTMGVNRMTERAFSERVRALRGPMWRIAWAMLRSGADCDDAVQEALLKAWTRIGSLREPARFETWLVRILINTARSMLRRRRDHADVESLPLAAPPADEELRDAIRTLDIQLRLPLILHHVEGYSIDECAQLLRLPRTTVKWRLNVARKKLREIMEVKDDA